MPALFRLLDPAAVRIIRPELITRARWAIVEQTNKVDSSWTEIPPRWRSGGPTDNAQHP
jgi:hypothetical protein